MLKLRRFVLDLTIVALFVPFVWVSFDPSPPGLRGHPFFLLDPFLCLGLVVAGVAPCVPMALLSAGTLLLGRRVRLAFCRYLCPFGALQRLVWIRPIGVRLGRLTGTLPRLGSWVLILGIATALAGAIQLHTLDPLVLTSRGIQYLTSLAGPAYDHVEPVWALPFLGTLVLAVGIYLPFCRCLCPVKPLLSAVPGGRALRVSRATRRIPVVGSRPFGRRRLLLGGSAVAVGGGAWWLGPAGGSGGAPGLRPPGALAGRLFLATCIRCGQCQSACPTGIIVPAGLGSGLDGLLTPVLDFSRGVCPPDCVACQRVCPTAALASLSPGERRQYRIGIARVLPELCVRKTGKLCRLCLEACPFDAVSVGVPGRPNAPAVERGLCVGCGICENACPVAGREGGPAIRVYPERAQ